MKFTAKKDTSLLEIIKNNLGFASNSKARNLIKSGAVKVDDKVVKFPSHVLSENQLVWVDDDFAKKSIINKKKTNSFNPIFEDENYIAFIKPAGLLSVSTQTKNKREKNFTDLISKQFIIKPGSEFNILPINRLDRQISGIMLFAKSGKAELAIRNEWQGNTKRYYALIEGNPEKEDGRIEAHLKQNRIGRVYSAPKSEYGKLCEINYRVMYKAEKYSLLKLDVVSERKNSIRAMLSEKKWPIAGDKDYKGHPSPIKRFGLHLFSLSFYHPYEKTNFEIKTPIPVSFKQFFKNTDKK